MKILKLLTLIPLAFGLLAAPSHAATQYHFASTSGEIISGSFIYNPEDASVFANAPDSYIYALSDLQGVWNGLSFSGVIGFATARQFNIPSIGLFGDYLSLSAGKDYGLGATPLDLNGKQYLLSSIQFVWDGIPSNISFLEPGLLPTVLPQNSSLYTHIRLEFREMNALQNIYEVMAYDVQYTAVPLPGAFWMMLVSIGGLVVGARGRVR